MPVSVRRSLGAREDALWQRQAGHYSGLEKICTAAAGRFTSTPRGQVGISPGDLPTVGKSPLAMGYTTVPVLRFGWHSWFVSDILAPNTSFTRKIVYFATR